MIPAFFLFFMLNIMLTDLNADPIQLSSSEDEIVTVVPYQMSLYDRQLASFYHSSPNHADKLERAAQLFLEQPYVWEPLGEGEHGKYSQEPLYRTDKFDCVSYVDTVLSLVKSKNIDEFKQNILAIRYTNALPDYINRTDWFTDLEWLPNAERLGMIKDVTGNIVDLDNHAIAKVAATIIEKPNWYQVKPLRAMHLFAPIPRGDQAYTLLQSLRSKHQLFTAHPSALTYLPLDKLFNPNGTPNAYFFDQIPSGSVIAVVRPDWPIRNNYPGFPNGYGTNLNVSHLGLVIRKKGALLFYHASSLQRKVVHEPLSQYLTPYLDSPTIKGIHIEQIL